MIIKLLVSNVLKHLLMWFLIQYDTLLPIIKNRQKQDWITEAILHIDETYLVDFSKL